MQPINKIKIDLKDCTNFKDIDVLIKEYITYDKPRDKKETYNNYKNIIYKILKEK